MSFSEDEGYIPVTIEQMMLSVMENINTQFGTSYTAETFLGTNFYKYFYALMQRVQESEVKTSEIFLRMQEYFNITNELIQRPNTTAPGIIDFFGAAGYLVSVQAPQDSNPGEVSICVDVDDTDPDYEDVIKPTLCDLVKQCVVAGVVSQGTETESITLSNGQAFDFSFFLPTKIPITLQLTIVISENNEHTILPDNEIAQILFDNINARYRLGLNFEPQTYFSVVDAPWAASILLEYDIGGGLISTVADLDFDELYTFEIGDITIVQS